MGDFHHFAAIPKPYGQGFDKILEAAKPMTYNTWRQLIKDPVSFAEDLGYDHNKPLSRCPESRLLRGSLLGVKVLLLENKGTLHIFARLQDKVSVNNYLARLTRPHCYQCDKQVTYLFEDGRCGACTRLTPEEAV
jgi:hypothetical protein